MKETTEQWLKAAEDDLRVVARLVADDDLTHMVDKLYIDARYPGEFGLLPDGKPTCADAQEFYVCAQSVYRQAKQALAAVPGI